MPRGPWKGRVEIVCELEAGSELLPDLLWSLVNAGVEVHEYSLVTDTEAPIARFVTADPDQAQRILEAPDVPIRRMGPPGPGGTDGWVDRVSRRFADGAQRLANEAKTPSR